jgi:hypothetical protein
MRNLATEVIGNLEGKGIRSLMFVRSGITYAVVLVSILGGMHVISNIVGPPVNHTKAGEYLPQQPTQQSREVEINRCIRDGQQVVNNEYASQYRAVNPSPVGDPYFQYHFAYEADQDMQRIRVLCEQNPSRRFQYDR